MLFLFISDGYTKKTLSPSILKVKQLNLTEAQFRRWTIRYGGFELWFIFKEYKIIKIVKVFVYLAYWITKKVQFF